MSAVHPGAHVLSCPTRWSDVDENGHINNARLVGYIQEGIYDLFCHHATAVRESLFPSGFIIARHEIDYLEQLHHQPEPLAVRLTVERLGRSSAHVEVNVCRDPRTFMRARTVVVARDRETGRSRKLSENERRFLSAFMPDTARTEAALASARTTATATAPAQRVTSVTAVTPVTSVASGAAGGGRSSARRPRRRCRASAG
ncbi:acyl-CoA thioester hydrolase [Streptomyces sp. 1114.5]|uniref:acyl-CoA thioesterase n=1 Tax=unclassified Streptomyces TaxID=2593676 RepID=UPI000BCCA41A|nr:MULTISPECIES: thioesterase family protein [unclassified Streptomyces]RKT19303.1 acyl-CoA thioester hydrolase [Streptomyces sp. 1114.5]SOB85500.1 acyl-CoA thioester hydrolase [Streptomyces sp. 1331.2]